MAAQGRPLLSTAQAARRLGVKPETLYAYVSRGLLASVRGPDGRASVFDPVEIDRLATRPRRGGAPRTAAFAVQTRLTDIRDGRLLYRGVDATVLAGREPFEAVARWLWIGVLDPTEFHAPAPVVSLARQLANAAPPTARAVDRLRAAVVGVAAADPLRADLRPDAVAATAATLLAAVVDGLPTRGLDAPEVDPVPAGVGLPRDAAGRHHEHAARPGSGLLARRLWPKLAPAPPAPGAVDLLDAALVLLADHDLAASTLAARIAASVRAHPYAVVAAGLAALDGPLHGGGSAPVHRALVEAEHEGCAAVLSRLLAEGRKLPGFGQFLYPDGDPRARALLDRLAETPPHPARWERVTEFLAASARGTPIPPNIDFALAALSYTAGMPADAGEAVFALGRTAGWIAHAAEEYAEEPHRFRPQSVYIGPEPTS
jgi:citrate synthase